MTLRTPRRRVSAQTKRRYRAIKGFFRRALGSSSQPDLQITSSIAVNVTDLKHKILGLEQQLNEVSKHCSKIDCFESNYSKKESQSIVPADLRDESSQENILSGTQQNKVETEFIYQSNSQHKKSEQCVVSNVTDTVKPKNNMDDFYYDEQNTRTKKKKSKVENKTKNSTENINLRKHKTQSAYENFVSAYSTSSFHSLDQVGDMLQNPERSRYSECQNNHTKVRNNRQENKMYKENLTRGTVENCDPYYEDARKNYTTSRKTKRISKDLDQDFIADIIKRQYKSIKMFGRRESDISQFSAPVCRDREFCQNSPTQDRQMYGCCYEGCHYNRHTHHSDHSDMRSVCDARLYSIKRNLRSKHRKKHADAYDSDIYDLVPVKEKSSPKLRRKFVEDNLPPAYYKEVPPSPRSHRPRLNLKTQLTDSDFIDFVKHGRKDSARRTMRHQETDELEDYYDLAEMQQKLKRQLRKQKRLENLNKIHDKVDMQCTMGTTCSLNNQTINTEENTARDETLNKTQETVSSADKTDKALCEIKDILQSFLQEIKKESSSNCCTDKGNNPPNEIPIIPKSGHSFNHYNQTQCPVAPAPYIPPFGNTCCYTMMPMCPMNCMQNTYPVPSTSCTCNACFKPNETSHNETTTKIDATNDTFKSETDQLIKEIYKFVSQSPTFCRKRGDSSKGVRNSKRAFNSTDNKVLTSRSAGGSGRLCRHDAKVGTPKMYCVSKSCEAIRSKVMSDTSSSETNASYSDTVLEKLSHEATGTDSTSETELSTELSEADKAKRNKFIKLMKSLGLYKKNKKGAIEVLESDSTIDVDVKRKKPPFQQEVTNYAVHGQGYYRPPPVSPHYRPEYPQDYRPPYNPDDPYQNPRMQQYINDREPHPQYHSEQRPTAPPCPNPYENYNQMQPPVPLCLKEIEVKSIGCQSERKMSFFQKITKKIQPPVETTRSYSQDKQKNSGTQTQTAQSKPGLFNWKNPQLKKIDSQNNPYAYGYKTQKKLAEGDKKIRNAMLKKMFYKKNPFSPGNLIIRTIMGRDKSSFGDPPAMYRARMFV